MVLRYQASRLRRGKDLLNQVSPITRLNRESMESNQGIRTELKNANLPKFKFNTSGDK